MNKEVGSRGGAERGLKVGAKARVDATRSGRTKAASRQFLTGGKICKCALEGDRG